ncbi:hypothetical protein BA190_03835 [Labrys sp. WJW]|uniref:DUF5906 domain-containing protein n=1 Tax=Labrys sp. WJW TaxID=1737983 RepID=UPI00082AB536|nr:DUF5906 domain-containing protein [Labrys sp. WJW]OCC06370.1 hypothetical protein BA190_03835 [Labrys sp. WJW]
MSLAPSLTESKPEALDLTVRAFESRNDSTGQDLTLSWPEFCRRIAKPRIGKTSAAQYMALPGTGKPGQETRTTHKDVGGFIAGRCAGGRTKDDVKDRCLVTLDVDHGAPLGEFHHLMGGAGVSGALLSHEWMAHTTRTHTADEPKFRILIPLGRPVSPVEYELLAEMLADTLLSTVEDSRAAIDSTCFRPTQFMFWPSRNTDGEFWTEHNRGSLVDPDEYLADVSAAELKERQRVYEMKLPDPREKEGAIGTLCTLFTLADGIRYFNLPYTPTRQRNRWSYAHGSGTDGAVLYDGGLYLKSYHESDPANNGHCFHLYDLVSIHRYGRTDAHKEMLELCRHDPKIGSHLPEEYRPFDADAAFDDEGPERNATDFAHLLDDEPAKPAVPGYVAKLNKTYAHIINGSKRYMFRDRPDGGFDLLTMDAFHGLLENKPKVRAEGHRDTSLSEAWLSHPKRREYEYGLTFEPGKPETPGKFNLWRGWRVTPDPDASKCKLILAHMRDVICNGNEGYYRYLLAWCAHMVQKPEQKPGVAVVLKGLKGIGKDTFGYYLRDLMNRTHYFMTSQPDQITGKFNAHLEGKLLFHLEEGYWAGDKKAEGVIKSQITAPNMPIERKGVDTIMMPSCLRILISSNESWVVPATEDDRRWFILNVSARRKEDAAYFRALNEELDGEGPAALLHYLQHHDFSDVDIRNPPKTDALAEEIEAGKQGIEAWWAEVLADGELYNGVAISGWPGGEGEVRSNALYNNYRAWMDEHERHRRKLPKETFGRQLRKIAPVRSANVGGGGREQYRVYRFAPLEECREYGGKRQ